MSRTRTASHYREQFSRLSEQVAALCNQTEFTDRDLAVAIELNQRYAELLEELEHAPIEIPAGVLVQVSGKSIQFGSIDQVSAWITESL